jgi:DNA-binding NtrC family response regulator
MGRDPKRLGADAAQALTEYPWPGNVRELEHAIERAVVLSQASTIAARDLPAETHREGAVSSVPRVPSTPSPLAISALLADLPFAEAKRAAMTQFEEAYVTEVMRRADGNLSEAARQAGVDRSNFKRILRKAKT